nr:ribonuclease H-like domain-containing protein [Tanacetum cinerariifolium]
MSWLDAHDKPIGDMEDKVDNLSPRSTPQVLPSFEVYTPPVTYPEEVEETIGILMEVEPLDHTKLEDLGLNTCSHDLFLSSRRFPSVDEPDPQPLSNLLFLDVNLGDERGTDPPINPYSLDAHDKPIGDMEDKVDNPSPQSTPQVLPSFEVYTPPVTYPEEVEETIGILMEVEPLDHTKLEDLGLNTCSHDLFLSSRRFPSVDEPDPQPLSNLLFLDVNLGDERGTDPPINPYSLGSLRMKVVEPLTIHTPPSPHVVIFDKKKLGSS